MNVIECDDGGGVCSDNRRYDDDEKDDQEEEGEDDRGEVYLEELACPLACVKRALPDLQILTAIERGDLAHVLVY